MAADGRLARRLDELGTAADEVGAALPGAQQVLDELATVHDDVELTTPTLAMTDTERLVASVRDLVASGRAHLECGDEDSAAAAVRGGEAALQRARERLEEVRGAGGRLASAEEDLRAALNSIHEDLREARRLGADDEVTTSALARAEPVIESATRVLRDGGDRLTALAELAAAERDIDIALTEPREAAEPPQSTQQRQVTGARLARRVRSTDAVVARLERWIEGFEGEVDSKVRSELIAARHHADRARELLDGDAATVTEELNVAMRHARYVRACIDNTVMADARATLGTTPSGHERPGDRGGPSIFDDLFDFLGGLLGGRGGSSGGSSSGYGSGGRF